MNCKIPSMIRNNNLNMFVYNDILYFINNDTVCLLHRDNKITIYLQLENDIKFFTKGNIFDVAATDDKIYVIYKNEIVTTMKKKITALKVDDYYIYIGNGHLFEIWEISKKYKFQMF